MEVIGFTTNGLTVIRGLSKLYFEQGLPLTFVFDKCQENGCIPSWEHLYQEFLDNKVPHERIIHLLNEWIFESYGKEFRDEVINWLNKKYGKATT